MRSLKAVIFDLDETLHDREATNEPYRRALFERCGHGEYETFCRRWQELDEWGHAAKTALFGGLVADGLLDDTVEGLIREYRELAWRQPHLMADAIEVLTELRHRGFKTGIITNGVAHVQQGKIEALNLAPFMDAMLISEVEGIRKPDPEIFHRAARRLQVDPVHCAYVGDHPDRDAAGAAGAGMYAVWFQRGTPWPADLEPAPHLTIHSLADLLMAPALANPVPSAEQSTVL